MAEEPSASHRGRPGSRAAAEPEWEGAALHGLDLGAPCSCSRGQIRGAQRRASGRRPLSVHEEGRPPDPPSFDISHARSREGGAAAATKRGAAKPGARGAASDRRFRLSGTSSRVGWLAFPAPQGGGGRDGQARQFAAGRPAGQGKRQRQPTAAILAPPDEASSRSPPRRSGPARTPRPGRLASDLPTDGHHRSGPRLRGLAWSRRQRRRRPRSHQGAFTKPWAGVFEAAAYSRRPRCPGPQSSAGPCWFRRTHSANSSGGGWCRAGVPSVRARPGPAEPLTLSGHGGPRAKASGLALRQLQSGQRARCAGQPGPPPGCRSAQFLGAPRGRRSRRG